MVVEEDVFYELEWLRYFYAQAQNGMGPASDDIYQMIKDSWTDAGRHLPKEYMGEDWDG